MRKIIKFLVSVAVILCLATYAFQLVHTCTECKKTFIGTGYRANILLDIASSEERILCQNCAKEQHALSELLGKSLSDYKIDMEWNPITVIRELVD